MGQQTSAADREGSLAWLARTAHERGRPASDILLGLLSYRGHLDVIQQAGRSSPLIAVIDQGAGVDAELDAHLSKPKR